MKEDLLTSCLEKPGRSGDATRRPVRRPVPEAQALCKNCPPTRAADAAPPPTPPPALSAAHRVTACS